MFAPLNPHPTVPTVWLSGTCDPVFPKDPTHHLVNHAVNSQACLIDCELKAMAEH